MGQYEVDQTKNQTWLGTPRTKGFDGKIVKLKVGASIAMFDERRLWESSSQTWTISVFFFPLLYFWRKGMVETNSDALMVGVSNLGPGAMLLDCGG